MYKYTTLAKLIVPAFLIFTFSLSAQTPDLPSEVEGVTTSWWSQVQKDIAQKEYVVNYDAKDKSYRAFNRKNGIISSLNAGKFSLKPTLDSGQTAYAWHTSLETASIEFDGVSTYQAKHASTAIQNENTVEFNHKDFTEQYVNTQQGIRQNFILHQGPKANQVRIKVKVNGLSLDKRNDNEIALYEKNKGGIQTHLLYKDIKSWDANGLALDSKLDVEGEYIVLVVNTTGAVYPITIDPISTTASTTLESNQADARFGLSVSSAGDVNGDGYSDVIVGAHYYDNGQTDEGGAFIYHGSASGISTTARTTLEINQAFAWFGWSVSSAGDVNGDGYSDVIVGAYLYDNGQSGEGGAFIYHGSASGIDTTASTALESNQAIAYFGVSVSSAGDVNGDGYSDVIVGAPFYDNGQINEGGAFIYHGSASGISSTASTTLESNQADAWFGRSVSSAGDVNGDGYSDVIVGAPFYDKGATDEGAAFIYHGSASGIDTTASDTLESNQASAEFGYSVASAGDVNGDGYSDVIVGAIYYDNGQTDEGGAFIYHGSASGISTTASTTLESNQASAYFGYSVSSAGDVNGDGYSDVIVGAYLYDNVQSSEGGAFIYHGSASGIDTTASTTLEENQDSAWFGRSVSSAGDVNGDGYSDVIVGASMYYNGQTDEGGAFIYHGSASGIDTTASDTLESNQANAQLGWSVSSAGDVNGDGYSDVIVGARYYDNGEGNEGGAFIYHGSSSGISTTASTTLESNQVSAWFGYSVSSAGDVNGDGYSDVIVGAPLYDKGQNNEGGAFIYHGSASGIDTTASTALEINQAGAWFGRSVSSAGDVNGDGYSDVIVGAYLYDNGQTDEGGAFIYHGSASGISTTASTTLESNQASAEFGYSVSSAGDVNGDGYSDVIVGASMYDKGATDEGAAFIYHGSASGIDTTASDTLESNQADARLGYSVASAGDVNGDGYSDVIVGAIYYDNGQSNEGGAFIYHGSASGIDTTASTTLEINQANAWFGNSVSSAGDVNGDGYSDVIVGAPLYDNGQANEGGAFIYHGAASGISTTASTTLEINQANAQLGWSVSSAGDVNGDGYSDVIVGAPLYDNGQINEGAAFIYHGNNGGSNNYGVLKDYDDDTSSLYTSASFSDANRGIGLMATSFLGRQKAKLAYETKSNRSSFSGSPFTNGVTNTGIQSSYTDLGISGSELKTTYVKDAFIRVRVKYDPVTAITGQMYGPWRYIKLEELSSAAALPVDLIHFTAQAAAHTTAELTWATATEIDNSHFVIERSYDARSFEAIDRVEGNGNSSEVLHYDYTDTHIAKGTKVVYYRLHQFDYNGVSEYSDVRRVIFGMNNLDEQNIAIYPNPFTSDVYIDCSTLSGGQVTIVVSNVAGQQLIERSISNTGQIEKVDLSSLPKGMYFVNVTSDTGTTTVKVIKR
jgi:hypothetical protein